MIGAGISNKRRKMVYHRDGYRCALCDNTKYIQIHHIIQRSRGGSDEMQNLITLCADCHALAHGTDLRGCPDATKEDVEQAIVEYMADYYACIGTLWNPWAKELERLTEEPWPDTSTGQSTRSLD